MSAETERTRPLWQGLLVILLGWLLLAYPMFMVGVGVIINFTGCLIGCGDPKPWVGALMLALLTVMLGLPVLAGSLAVKPSRRLSLVTMAVGTLLLLAAAIVTLSGAM